MPGNQNPLCGAFATTYTFVAVVHLGSIRIRYDGTDPSTASSWDTLPERTHSCRRMAQSLLGNLHRASERTARCPAPLDRVGEGNSVAQGFEGKPWASVRASSIRKVTGKPATKVSAQDNKAEPDIWQNLHTAQSFHLGSGAADETWDRRGRVQWHTSRL